MKRVMMYIFLSFLLISAASGQEVRLSSTFDTSRIYIGDQIKYSIEIDQPSDVMVSLPFFKDTLCKNIEILAGPIVDSSFINENRIKIIQKYLVTSFDTGYYQLPPVFAELKTENGLKRFYSDYAQLEVIRVGIAPADSTAKIFDIIEPYRAPLTMGEILPWLLLAIIVTAIVWAAIKYIPRLKKNKEGLKAVINPDPAHIIAFRELEELKQDQLWQKGEIKNYYTRLTEILRQYLENRFNVFSLELTTSETLEALLRSGFKKDASYKQLKLILTGADMVKFAKHNPEPSENDVHYQNSWDFVVATKIDEIIIEESGNKNKAGEEVK